MQDKYHFLIVDDDPDVVNLITTLLRTSGHRVDHENSALSALSRLEEELPDCIFVDILLPDMDGMELIRQLRHQEKYNHTKIIVVSAKAYHYDRKRALQLGADAFILKPINNEQFVTQVERTCKDHIELTFWGVRGTLPVPGPDTVRYGGNTLCVSMEFAKGYFLIFDAGTGIKALSNHLLAQNRKRIEAKIFITHPHWDHLNALPFFAPLYSQGNTFEILGASHADEDMEALVSAQMDGVYSPITIHEFGASVRYRNLKEESLEIDGIRIQTKLLNHPGTCLGYRVEYKDRSICYITDNELYPQDTQFYNSVYVKSLTHFVAGTDALIIDSTYTDQEYKTRMHWGHSPLSEVVNLAHDAKVKVLYLVHHDPDQTDSDIDKKLDTARALLKKLESETVCVAPVEQNAILI